MISNWIKIRVDLHTDPKIIEMARRLDYMTNADPDYSVTLRRVTRNNWRHIVVGGVCQVWGVVGARGKRHDDDLVVSSATLQTLDDIVQLDGFGDAMQHVGWVGESDSNLLIFRNFFNEYNADKAASFQAKNAERQARYRAKLKEENSNATVTLHNNVTVTSPRNTEKSREEKNIYSARHELLALGIPDDLIRDWLEIRKKKKQPLTKTGLDATIREAGKAGLSLEQAITVCCERGWAGFRAKYLEENQKHQPVSNGTPVSERFL